MIAINIGTTTIKITTTDNLQATCNVTVTPIESESIVLNKSSVSLKVGQEEAILATVSPESTTNKTVIWSSENDGIATVDNTGNIKAVGVGATTITAKTINNKTAICSVIIEPINVTGIAINETLKTIEQNEKYTLVATINPVDATNKNITWISNNPNIATVSDAGIVTGVNKGNTTIIAKTEDGSYTAECDFTVTEIKVRGVSLNKTTLTLAIGETNTLIPNITPFNAANLNKSWDSSNASIATINSNGTITPLSKGVSIISVTTEDGGFTANCNLSVLPIDELVEIKATGRSFTASGGKIYFTLNSNISNPSSVPITLNSIWLVDSANSALEIKPGGNVLSNNSSHTTVFSQLSMTTTSMNAISNFINNCKIVYQFSSNGNSYQVTKSFNGNVWQNL